MAAQEDPDESAEITTENRSPQQQQRVDDDDDEEESSSPTSPPSSPASAKGRTPVPTSILAFLTAGAIFLVVVFIFSSSQTIRCLEDPSSSYSRTIRYPQINWRDIPQISPTLHPSLSFPRWIVVAAPAAATPAIHSLSVIKDWKLLIVADVHTPPNFSVPQSALFLSLPQQAALGYRSLAYLPLSSPQVRKTVGYLFAIQHGAKVIYDADSRGEVIGNDLSRHFDVKFTGEPTVLLQYNHANMDRRVVNPYVHFGQPSVWPRGYPIEHVGNIMPEEFFTEVHGGRQFIQQGLANGLPDVDALFYFTRKSSGLEAFDLSFDSDAPKVAAPQGVMVPVNSFNTLFHSPAFWGLALPVSISSMASDVIRGYWAQRILWEIGGFVTVHPPTVHRIDKSEAYPFADERDIHVNIQRMLDFLHTWRSNKQTLFERILHLSYSMTEEGFWTERDTNFMAAWLQDLISVGYPQPRLMSLEIDLPQPTIGEGDQRKFVPRKLPSIHLGVEETGEVSSTVGNLIRWRKHFGDVVLIMYCTGTVERTALEWRLLYGRIFKTVIILSDRGNPDLVVQEAHIEEAYKYFPKVFNLFSGAEGFLFLQDDMIVNYWNLLHADKTKLWITNKIMESWVLIPLSDNKLEWFIKQGELVRDVFHRLPLNFQHNYRSHVNEDWMIYCSSEMFYIPRQYVAQFSYLVQLVGDSNIHHKVAVPLFFRSMDTPQNFDSDALAKIVYRTNLTSGSSFATVYSAAAPAVYPIKVQNELDFVNLIKLMSFGDPLLSELI